ncbi:MAG: hypothetical protein IJG53_00740 [Eggerthellaceae bacterium]|nr:hypothetical protein [Eggerthellaceae bacterium]
MRKVMISDITMKQAPEAGGFSLSFREKIELAKLLDKLGASVVELGPVESPKSDRLLIKSVALAVKDSVVAVPVALMDADSVAFVADALAEAKHPRLQVCAPVSVVQMEYFIHKKPDAVLAAIADRVTEARARCANVEFVAQDATRADEAFLARAISAAVEAGATGVTITDEAGNLLVDEFKGLVARTRAALPEGVALGVCCANTLFMADANAVAAIEAGADEVKACACGTFTASLPNIARILDVKGSAMGVGCGVRTVELDRITKQIAWMCETRRSANSPFDAGVREEDAQTAFTAHDSREEVARAITALGYDLSEEDVSKVYAAFARLSARKETISPKELDAIVAAEALQVPQTYKLESYVINSGNTIMATCHMRLAKEGEVLDAVALGDGPVDASFLAIEQIVGRHYELDDFQIRAVTEGREALGETVIRLRADDGRLYSGRGLSTDVIGSSILAYVAAVNKIVWEEAEV